MAFLVTSLQISAIQQTELQTSQTVISTGQDVIRTTHNYVVDICIVNY